MNSPILSLESIEKTYFQGESSIKVLQGVTLNVAERDTLAIVGQSGSGKSTLLSIMAGLDRPDQGDIRFQGQTMNSLSERGLGQLRAGKIGIVFQQFHLMPALTALENVLLSLEITKAADALERAKEALNTVGLSHRVDHLPRQLSGGERQRVAIARAFVGRPALLLADEPSGNLDQETGLKVMDLLFRIVSEAKMTMILVTHNRELARQCARETRLEKGHLLESPATL